MGKIDAALLLASLTTISGLELPSPDPNAKPPRVYPEVYGMNGERAKARRRRQMERRARREAADNA